MKVRKSVMLLCNICLILFFSFSNAFSESIRISRIDSNSLLLNQKIKVYLSVTDENGKPVKDLGIDNFEIFESPENHTGQEREILAFEKGVNINRGINLLLVLDNSGSMYWDGSGKIKNSTDQEIWRITYAKEAITSLLKEIKNPLDRVGLFTFNVKIDTETALTTDRVKIVKAIIEIKKPSEEEAYTELYETLYQAVNYLRVSKGRKIIIVLSDGQNFPLDKNPHFPERYGIEGAIDSAQKEGISVFTIGLSKKADRKNLRRIAEETGGAYFSVYDPGRLEDLYNMIRDQILNEYLVTYSA
ncbi:MAG: VWA domain-containing protein, partial [Spirochaetes bacterium]|nr:VWA domain-containing protein [Spirochaetota bacterium]